MMKKRMLKWMGGTLVGGMIFSTPIAFAADYNSNGAITFEAETNPITIDHVSDFQFNNQKITTATMDYYAELDSSSGTAAPNYIRVTDIRGNQKGWKLDVKQTEQFQTMDKDTLTGAQLSIKNGVVNSETDMRYAPGTVLTTHTFVPGTAVTVVTAEERQGMGAWDYQFGSDAAQGASSVVLNVPGAAVKLAKEYTTVMTWSLTFAP